jgi:hypothetical protein
MDNHILQTNINYRLLANVKDKIQLGGIVNYSTLYYRNEYWDSHHNYWRTKINLGLSICYPLKINEKWLLFIPVNLPILGCISRPATERNLVLNEPNADINYGDMLKQMHSNFKFVAIGYKYFEIETGIFFRVKLKSSSLHRLTFGYGLFYEQTTVSLKSQLLVNQMKCSLHF